MSGIYGIFAKDETPVTSQMLEPMRQAMTFWGPDGQGQWTGGSVGLGHLMLHTTPESLQERLPLRHPHLPDLVITADAWLDNREELFARLAVPTDEQAAMPDSLLLLLAYEKWGTACVEKLLGDFAFAIWDGRQQQLFCGRDLFGNKPFRYYEDSKHFIFASDIKGVLAQPQTPKQLYEPLLAAYLQQQTYHAQKRYTFWDQVVNLPPAHTLTVTAKCSQLACYWSPTEAAEIRLASAEAYADQLRNLLRQAVECRLRTAFPVGAHLSGGLDSSTVTALANQQLRQRGRSITAFSWSPPPNPAEVALTDERAMVAAVCAQEEIRCHYLVTGVAEALTVMQRDVTTEPSEMVWREEQVQQQAQADGIRVLLSGWGGDEVVSIDAGSYLADLASQWQWQKFYAEGRQRIENRLPVTQHGDPLRLLRNAKAWYHQLYLFVAQPLLPEPILLALSGRKASGQHPNCYIEPTFAQRYQAEVLAMRNETYRFLPQVRVNQWQRLGNGHLTRRLEDWTTNGARHQVVYRYPLLDRRLLEFCLGIPAEQYSYQGRTRSLIRRAGQGILPPAFLWHPPKNDPAAVGVVKQTHRRLLPQWLDQVLSSPAPPKLTHYVQIDRVKEVRKKVEQLDPAQTAGLKKALTCFSIQQLV